MSMKVRVEDGVFEYIYKIIAKTRDHFDIETGASPRAGIALMQTAKANALLNGRDYVNPDDIIKMAKPVLRHRLLVRADLEQADLSADEVIEEIVRSEPIPR